MTTFLAINWAVVGIKAGQLILCLSIIVIWHELGHFLPAKWFKCRVEKFFLFFDPWFALIKKKIGETTYGIGWLPLGGYVKISGMIDESMDKEQMKQPPQSWEFRSKPAWQRLIIMVGGVTMNLIMGFMLFAMILYTWGEDYLPAKNAKYGIYVDSLGQRIGLKNGDRILSVDSQPVQEFYKISNDVILNQAKTLQVERDGQQISVPVPPGTVRELIQRKGKPLAFARFPAVVDSVSPHAHFVEGRLEKGDRIVSVNDTTVFSPYEVIDRKNGRKNAELNLGVLRGADTVKVKVVTNDKGEIGYFNDGRENKYLDYVHVKYTFWESLPAGVAKSWTTLVMNVQNFKLLFTSNEVKPSESLGSFISIGNMFDPGWDWQRFWGMTAFLSVVLAFMNILPIPALDGGHVLFTLYEIITGRKPGEKFMEYAQMVGMVLLLTLMAYAIGLDFWRVLFKH